jgi:Beta-lactamase class C and other penicillin binding proteins
MKRGLFAVACAFGVGSCAVPPATPVTPGAIEPQLSLFRPELSARLDSIITAAIADHATPGAAVGVGRNGHVAILRGYGRLDWNDPPTAHGVDENTIYDMASLTKVIASTTAAMMLEESGQLDIDRTVASYLPGLNAPDKANITVRQILTHRGGFEAFAALFKTYRGREQYLEQINARPLASQPGTKTVYSDWDFILMQLIIERITGMPLDTFVSTKIFEPLGMHDTRYRPPPDVLSRIAPTEIDTTRGGLVHGFVHDENAWAMGGVAGHAGLFSTAHDLCIFAQMMLNGGEYNGVRLLKPATIARWTARQGPESSRALGWDTPSRPSSAGHYFSARSFGHTGFTGTSIWMDPEKQLFVILLTNRVDPTRDNQKIGAVRRAVADAVQQAAIGAPLIDWESRQ